MNAVACRENEVDFRLIDDESFVLKANMRILVAGLSSDITAYSAEKQAIADRKANSGMLFNKISKFFSKK